MKRNWIFLGLVLTLLLGFAPQARAQERMGPVGLIEVTGVINPLSSSYLERGLRLATQEAVSVLILRLDTPGGLETAMRDMVQQLLDSTVPTVVYVAPEGARATSAGLFIAMAADVVAMAPATHIGAAHPVPLGADVSDVMDEKMTSDAAALIRSVAARRGRNATWAEQAVRENLSLTAQEALESNVAEIIAVDLDDLLNQLDGRTVETIRGTAILRTRGAAVERWPMNIAERFLHLISEPNIAYLLLSLGTLFLLTELAEPGLSVAGIGSVVSFAIAFMALGSLPVNWVGIGLLALSVILFVVGILTDTEPIITVAGIIPFILGSLMLFAPFVPSSPAAPALRVSPWLIAIIALAVLGFSMVILRAVVAAMRLPVRAGADRLIGMEGRAITPLTPEGQVRVDRADWSAYSTKGDIPVGHRIRVTGFSGVRLYVVPVEAEAPTAAEAAEEPPADPT